MQILIKESPFLTLQVHRNISALPSFRNPVVTIGTFDGVHLGHKQIINQLKTEALRIDGEMVIITFYPHPRKIISPQAHLELLNTTEEKIALLDKEKIDHLIIVPFTLEFSERDATSYIEDFLVAKIKPHTIIIGYDHHFGKGREGNYMMLESFSTKCGFTVKEIPEKLLYEAAVSSTRIRNALFEGNITTANELLGYDYFFSGTVVGGNRIGNTIGYPTANIQPNDEEKLIPAKGIYAVEVLVQDKKFLGMMSIGVRPTIGDDLNRVIEVNIFDFSSDIYGSTITVYFKYFMRTEEKFSDLDELKEQLAMDKVNALRLLGGVRGKV